MEQAKFKNIIENNNSDSILVLKEVISNGAGSVFRVTGHPPRIIGECDIARAKETIKNLSKPLAKSYIASIARNVKQAEKRAA
jgi:hypothetical protein